MPALVVARDSRNYPKTSSFPRRRESIVAASGEFPMDPRLRGDDGGLCWSPPTKYSDEP